MQRTVRILRVSPQVLLSVFSLVPDLLLDCSRVLEYAKIRTVLQSSLMSATIAFQLHSEKSVAERS